MMNRNIPESLFDLLIRRITDFGPQEALVWNDNSYSYKQLLDAVNEWRTELSARNCRAGEVIGLQGEFSLPAIAALLALFDNGNVAVLIPPAGNRNSLLAAGRVNRLVQVSDTGCEWHEGPGGSHPLLEKLGREGRPGFVLFSSGSSGTPKAILHDLNLFLGKFRGATEGTENPGFSHVRSHCRIGYPFLHPVQRWFPGDPEKPGSGIYLPAGGKPRSTGASSFPDLFSPPAHVSSLCRSRPVESSLSHLRFRTYEPGSFEPVGGAVSGNSYCTKIRYVGIRVTTIPFTR